MCYSNAKIELPLPAGLDYVANERAKLELAKQGRFSALWWEQFAVHWNSHETNCLAGLGEMIFEVSDAFIEVGLTWDATGKVAVHSPQRSAGLRLIAKASNWDRFVRGDFSPVDGVLQGKIRIEGDLPRLMRYINRIDAVCIVARKDELAAPR